MASTKFKQTARGNRDMKSFGQTAGSNIDTSSFDRPQANYMKLAEAEGHVLIVLSANKGKTEWGDKFFLKCVIEGDEDAVEYTIPCSDKSAVFAQMDTAILADGADLFPFRASIQSIGRTYQLVDPPAKKVPAPSGRKPANGNTSTEKAPW